MKIGVIGYGVVGSAVAEGFLFAQHSVIVKDKFKVISVFIGDIYQSDMIFVCVPTPTSAGFQDLDAVCDVLLDLSAHDFKGPVILKSTVLPGACEYLQNKFDKIKLVHNPEFLSDRSAKKDFVEQKSIILSSPHKQEAWDVADMYHKSFPYAEISISANFKETEMAKYMHNCFGAIKVTVMNEFSQYCKNIGVNYDAVKTLAISQGYLSQHYTQVPGHDGKSGFGGACFPKDTEALSAQDATGILSILRQAITANKKLRE
jgi:nucleotide sugar dehydrogenase